jgi:hypothetical protein
MTEKPSTAQRVYYSGTQRAVKQLNLNLHPIYTKKNLKETDK